MSRLALWLGLGAALGGAIGATVAATRPVAGLSGASRRRRRNLGDAERPEPLPPGFRDREELHTLLRIVATPKDRIIPFSLTIPRRRAAVPERPADYSEEAGECFGRKCRLTEDVPPEVSRYPVGTFSFDDSFSLAPEINELRELRFDDPRVRFSEYNPVNRDRWQHDPTVAKYTRWIRAGHEPPPVNAVEHEKGTIGVTNGHHRSAALHRAGRRSFKAWVALTHNYPLTRTDGKVVFHGRGVTQEQARQLLDEARAWRRARMAP